MRTKEVQSTFLRPRLRAPSRRSRGRPRRPRRPNDSAALAGPARAAEGRGDEARNQLQTWRTDGTAGPGPEPDRAQESGRGAGRTRAPPGARARRGNGHVVGHLLPLTRAECLDPCWKTAIWMESDSAETRNEWQRPVPLVLLTSPFQSRALHSGPPTDVFSLRSMEAVALLRTGVLRSLVSYQRHDLQH